MPFSKERAREILREWIKNHPGSNKKYSNTRRYGGLREMAIIRDDEKCVNCGLTRQRHKNKWGRDINVDNIDGSGRSVLKHFQNNELNNLQTLCLSCHGKKDILRRKDFQERGKAIYAAQGSVQGQGQ